MSKFAQLCHIAHMREGVELETIRENPIARRSKKFIADALMDLLHEKAFDKITIKEIMERADMARRTFYGNFSSKDEIIQYYFKSLFDDLRNKAKSEEKVGPRKLMEMLFELALEDKDNMMVAKKQGLLNLAFIEKYSEEFARFLSGTGDMKGNTMVLNYAAGFYLGGMWRMLDQWLGEGAKDSPKKMAEMFQNMMSGQW